MWNRTVSDVSLNIFNGTVISRELSMSLKTDLTLGGRVA